MMHEVNMTCKIDAQFRSKNRQDRRKYDVRFVVCVDNKGRMQKRDNPQKDTKLVVYAR